MKSPSTAWGCGLNAARAAGLSRDNLAAVTVIIVLGSRDGVCSSPEFPTLTSLLLAINLSQPPPWLPQRVIHQRLQPLPRQSPLATLSLFQTWLTSPELMHTCTKVLTPPKWHTCRGRSPSRNRSFGQKLSKEGDVFLGLSTVSLSCQGVKVGGIWRIRAWKTNGSL